MKRRHFLSSLIILLVYCCNAETIGKAVDLTGLKFKDTIIGPKIFSFSSIALKGFYPSLSYRYDAGIVSVQATVRGPKGFSTYTFGTNELTSETGIEIGSGYLRTEIEASHKGISAKKNQSTPPGRTLTFSPGTFLDVLFLDPSGGTHTLALAVDWTPLDLSSLDELFPGRKCLVSPTVIDIWFDGVKRRSVILLRNTESIDQTPESCGETTVGSVKPAFLATEYYKAIASNKNVYLAISDRVAVIPLNSFGSVDQGSIVVNEEDLKKEISLIILEYRRFPQSGATCGSSQDCAQLLLNRALDNLTKRK
ncbi:MAG: hypothetical protein P4L76_13920 [Beijerinckiaceae bacterium]|nr:hypothetical protein [Beijerinckiaceae bacterium]